MKYSIGIEECCSPRTRHYYVPILMVVVRSRRERGLIDVRQSDSSVLNTTIRVIKTVSCCTLHESLVSNIAESSDALCSSSKAAPPGKQSCTSYMSRIVVSHLSESAGVRLLSP